MIFPERNNPSDDEPTGGTGQEQGPDQGFDEEPDSVDLTPPDQGFGREPDKVEKDKDPEAEER